MNNCYDVVMIKKSQIRNTIANVNQHVIAMYRVRIENIGRPKATATAIFDLFCKSPRMTITQIVEMTGLPRPTITNTIKKMVDVGILQALNNQKWGQVYCFGALVGSGEDFATSTTQTQQKNGCYIGFAGKDYAVRLADLPTKTRIKPNKTHNDQEINKNSPDVLYVGDNLDIMKLLRQTHQNSIDLIYFDPPYAQPSTRQIRAYNDSFDGHCDFLAMMYPRLILAQRLLSPDGLIAISISEHEIAQLKMLLDEVFEAENFINNIVIETGLAVGVYTGYSNKRLPNVKSYLLVYAKDKTQINNLARIYDPVDAKFAREFNTIIDENLHKHPLNKYLGTIEWVKGLFETNNMQITVGNIEKMMQMSERFERYIYEEIAPMLYKVTTPKQMSSKLPLNTPQGQIFIHDGMLLESQSDGSVRHYKSFLNRLQETDAGEISNSYIRGDIWKGVHKEKSRIQAEGGVEFSAGKKPVRLLTDLLTWINKKDAVVLDGFAGSGTMGHAVWTQNARDGGCRQFVLCQLPEQVAPNSIEATQGFKTIDQITKKRLKNITQKYGTGFQIFTVA